MKEHLEFAKDLAYQAGEIMKANFRVGVEHIIKDDNSPVTNVDTAVNKLVIAGVQASFPGHGVLGEEESFETHVDNLWVVDPVDGTIPFLRGIPTNVFSLGYVEKGVPKLGVIYDPYMNRMLYASVGDGAFMNDEKISVSDKTSLDNSYITHEGRRLLSNMDYRQKLEERKTRIMCLASVTYELAMMASGQFDATVFAASSAHDVAAAKVIVEEAGGVTSDLLGREQLYNQRVHGFIAAATPELLKELVEVYAGSVVDPTPQN